MNTFYITGLPRSRTSWIANLLSTGHAICLHEPTRYARSVDAINRVVASAHDAGYARVGICDSGLLLYLDLVPHDAKLVILRRPVEDVIDSTSNLYNFDTSSFIRHLSVGLGSLQDRQEHMVVDFSDLSQEDACRSVFEYCIPDQMWCSLRWKELHRLSVEPRSDLVLADLRMDEELTLKLENVMHQYGVAI